MPMPRARTRWPGRPEDGHAQGEPEGLGVGDRPVPRQHDVEEVGEPDEGPLAVPCAKRLTAAPTVKGKITGAIMKCSWTHPA